MKQSPPKQQRTWGGNQRCNHIHILSRCWFGKDCFDRKLPTIDMLWSVILSFASAERRIPYVRCYFWGDSSLRYYWHVVGCHSEWSEAEWRIPFVHCHFGRDSSLRSEWQVWPHVNAIIGNFELVQRPVPEWFCRDTCRGKAFPLQIKKPSMFFGCTTLNFQVCNVLTEMLCPYIERPTSKAKSYRGPDAPLPAQIPAYN